MKTNKQILSEVDREFYTGKEAVERKQKRQKKDLQEVVRQEFGERQIING